MRDGYISVKTNMFNPLLPAFKEDIINCCSILSKKLFEYSQHKVCLRVELEVKYNKKIKWLYQIGF